MNKPIANKGDNQATKLASSLPTFVEYVIKDGQVVKKPPPAIGRHFHVVSAFDELLTYAAPHGRIPSVSNPNIPFAVAAEDVRSAAELRRITSLAEYLCLDTSLLLVAGYHADDVAASTEATELRRHLENQGAVFVPRPEDAATLQQVAEFLDQEYAPQQAAIDAALKPRDPLPVLEGHHVSPYLEPLPEGFDGDPFFLVHLDNPKSSTKEE